MQATRSPHLPGRNKRSVTVRLDVFNRMLAERNLTSNLEVARFLGCGEGTISRIRNGEQTAGAGFIACVAIAMGPEHLAEVFDFGGES